MGEAPEYVGSAAVRTRWFTSSLAGVTALALLAASGCGEQAAAIRVGDHYVSQADFMDEVRDVYDTEDDEGSIPQEVVGQVATQRVVHQLIVDLYDGEGLELTDGDREAGCVAYLESFLEQEVVQAQQAGQVVSAEDLTQVRSGLLIDPCGDAVEAVGLAEASDRAQDDFVDEQAMLLALQQERMPAHLRGIYPLDLFGMSAEDTQLQELAAAFQTADQDLSGALEDLLDTTDITINSKYGTWDSDALLEGGTAVAPPVGPLAQVEESDEPDESDAPGAGVDPSGGAGMELTPEEMEELMADMELDPDTVAP